MTSPFFSKKARREAELHAKSYAAHVDSTKQTDDLAEQKRHKQAALDEAIAAGKAFIGVPVDHEHLLKKSRKK